MLVVSDASPLNVLVRIEHVDVLPKLFGRVVIPTAVAHELSHRNTPLPVQEWLASRPAWLEVLKAAAVDLTLPLDQGESEAIALARELHADLLLLDDLDARRIAVHLGLRITGTIGVLELADVNSLIDLPAAIDRIRQTNFAVAERILDEALARHRMRRGELPPG